MKLVPLHELWVHELRDLYSAEQQMVQSLPAMAVAASSPQLKQAFEPQVEETRRQVQRVEVFRELGESPGGELCIGMRGLVEEGSDMIEEDADPTVKDAGLVVAAQKAEHCEIASYDSCCVFAETLGFDRAKQILKQTLSEEKAADKKLSAIAERVINVPAAMK